MGGDPVDEEGRVLQRHPADAGWRGRTDDHLGVFVALPQPDAPGGGRRVGAQHLARLLEGRIHGRGQRVEQGQGPHAQHQGRRRRRQDEAPGRYPRRADGDQLAAPVQVDEGAQHPEQEDEWQELQDHRRGLQQGQAKLGEETRLGPAGQHARQVHEVDQHHHAAEQGRRRSDAGQGMAQHIPLNPRQRSQTGDWCHGAALAGMGPFLRNQTEPEILGANSRLRAM